MEKASKISLWKNSLQEHLDIALLTFNLSGGVLTQSH